MWGEPNRSLADVLPYLATLPGVIGFNPEAGVLTFRRQPGFITLYRDRVYITQVKDVEEGLELLEALRDAINTTWEHRSEMSPVHTRQRAARPLDIYNLLPQSNCKQCGEATCMAFAFALLMHKRVLTECQPLSNDSVLDERRAALEALI